MKQDKSPQSMNGQTARAAQVTEAKARQRENALLRSKTDIRRTSSASTSNPQSEVTERPPALYQVPPINVPDNLHDCAKLIHSELTKIANSQSVLLSLWEKVKDQANTADVVEFKKSVRLDDALYINGQSVSWLNMWMEEFDTGNSQPNWGYYVYGAPHMALAPYSIRNADSGFGTQLADNCDTAPPNSTVFTYAAALNAPPTESVLVTYGALNNSYMGQLAFGYAADQIFYRCRDGDNSTWYSWHQLTPLNMAEKMVEEMRLQVKREIYAELMELNAGIVTPVVMNGSHNEN